MVRDALMSGDVRPGEIYEMRVLLEVASIEKIAERGLGPAEPRLRELLEAGESAAASGAMSEFLHVDRNFHIEVLELLGNRRLVSAVSNLRDQTRLHGLKPAAQRGQLGISASEHRTLLEALCRQDVNAAREAMLRLLEHARADWASRQPSTER